MCAGRHPTAVLHSCFLHLPKPKHWQAQKREDISSRYFKENYSKEKLSRLRKSVLEVKRLIAYNN